MIAELTSLIPSYRPPTVLAAAVLTDLLSRGLPLEDVQRLAGYADSRTPRLYESSRQEGHAQHLGTDFDLSRR